MQYAITYAQAPVWTEVERYLFKLPDYGVCVVCGILTQFMDYAIKKKPSFICSTTCFMKIARVVYCLVPSQPLTDIDIEKDSQHGT